MTSTLDHVDELVQFPEVHPYRKYWGTHWRLVELADLQGDGCERVGSAPTLLA